MVDYYSISIHFTKTLHVYHIYSDFVIKISVIKISIFLTENRDFASKLKAMLQ